jgi:hypothetical protein
MSRSQTGKCLGEPKIGFFPTVPWVSSKEDFHLYPAVLAHL